MPKTITMNRFKRIQIDYALLQSLVFYFVLAGLLIPHYQYQIDPDGVSYIGIAQKYLRHDFGNAINGYWGPLFSWLLTPFLATGTRPLLAAKLLSIIIGLVVIIQSNELIKIMQINQLFRTILLYIIALFTIYCAFTETSPDLLLIFFALAFLNTVLSPAYQHSKYAGVKCGILGAGLYFTKSYGLPFFMAIFIITNLIFYLRTKDGQKRAIILRNFITGLAVCSLIAAGWIALLSDKYGRFTVSTSANYNHVVVGPKSLGHPMHIKGLLDPPNNTAISVWEDISYTKVSNWSVFDSIGSLIHQIKIALNNIGSIITKITQFSVFSLIILSAAVVYLVKQGKRMVEDNLLYLLLTAAVLYSGYLMFLVEPRYIWLSYILIFVCGAKLLDIYSKKFQISKQLRTVLVVIFAASFAIYPVQKLYSRRETGKEIYDLSNRLSYLNIEGRIASSGYWGKTLHLSFYNNWRYYGEKGQLTLKELETQFENKQINYYLVWKPFNEHEKLDRMYQEITNGSIDELKVYKIK